MKKLLLILVASSFAFNVYSQGKFRDTKFINLSVANTLDVYDEHTYFDNKGSDANDSMFVWTVIDNVKTSGWELNICSGFECITNPSKSEEFKVLPGDSMYFKVGFGLFKDPGNGSFKLVTYSKLNPAQKDTLSMQIKTWGASVVNVNKSSFSLYPNPATNVVRINFEKGGSEEVKVYDILGNLQITTVVTSGNLLDITSLSKGVYVVRTNGATAYSKILHKQ